MFIVMDSQDEIFENAHEAVSDVNLLYYMEIVDHLLRNDCLTSFDIEKALSIPPPPLSANTSSEKCKFERQ
jgi:hypothetical protein